MNYTSIMKTTVTIFTMGNKQYYFLSNTDKYEMYMNTHKYMLIYIYMCVFVKEGT